MITGEVAAVQREQPCSAAPLPRAKRFGSRAAGTGVSSEYPCAVSEHRKLLAAYYVAIVMKRCVPSRVLPLHVPPIGDSVKGTAFALSSHFLPFGQVVNVYVEYFYIFRPEVPPLGRLIRPGTLGDHL
jgi:hypothetical protein